MAGNDSTAVVFLVPGDPDQRTGGYRYVGQLVRALNRAGCCAKVQGLEGQFPIPDAAASTAMDQALSACENGAIVVLDGLAMGGLPEVLEKHAARLRLIALVHHPLADETGISDSDSRFLKASETRALAAVGTVITTSRFTAQRLADFKVSPAAIQVIEPGADTVSSRLETASWSAEGAEPLILCVASLSPRKAQHQLVQALGELRHLPWECTLAGSTERSPEYSQQVAEQIQGLSLGDRVSMVGELDDDALADLYRNADLFVLPSLYEGYGMVIDEALAAGLPVITSNGGALASTGNRPGVSQYPAGSVDGLRQCLEDCLSDRDRLQALTVSARGTGERVRQWSDAANECLRALALKPDTRDHSQFDQQWLALREPADHRARSLALLEQLQAWVKHQDTGTSTLHIADLGAGAGSNGVYLSDRLAVPQHWTLLDQDPSLLAEAGARLRPAIANVETLQCNLETGNLNHLIPVETRLITASALIDLTSAPWLDALADTARARQAAVLIVLSYAGAFQLSPEHPDDDLLRSLVNQHQHGDKGSGAALGPEATDYLKGQLQARDYQVSVAPSPWKLAGEDGKLQAALIAGWCEAAIEQAPAERPRIEQWQKSRLEQAGQGALSVQVDHHDLLAWPRHA